MLQKFVLQYARSLYALFEHESSYWCTGDDKQQGDRYIDSSHAVWPDVGKEAFFSKVAQKVGIAAFY